MTHIGVLTAGGDCPGLNAAIRGVVARAVADGVQVSGVADGWAGLMDGRVGPLGRDDVRGILTRGGTILGTSRTDPYEHGGGLASLSPVLEAAGIDVVVVIGGDGTLRTATRLADEGLAVVGVPKTIDNDIEGTDISFGFDTAVQIVTDAGSTLYGFMSALERTLFQRLLTASGVGGKVALAMMSTYPAERLARAIVEKDTVALQQVPGIGKKTAEKLAVELSDRVADLAVVTPSAGGATAAAGGAAQAAVQALVSLGYSFGDADKAVRKALASGFSKPRASARRLIVARMPD